MHIVLSLLWCVDFNGFFNISDSLSWFPQVEKAEMPILCGALMMFILEFANYFQWYSKSWYTRTTISTASTNRIHVENAENESSSYSLKYDYVNRGKNMSDTLRQHHEAKTFLQAMQLLNYIQVYWQLLEACILTLWLVEITIDVCVLR